MASPQTPERVRAACERKSNRFVSNKYMFAHGAKEEPLMTGLRIRLLGILMLPILSACGGPQSASTLTLTGNTFPAITNDSAPTVFGDEYKLDPFFGVEDQFGARGFWLNHQSLNLWPGTGAATTPYFTVDPTGNVTTSGSITVDSTVVVSSGSGAPHGSCSPGSFYTRTDASATAGAEAYVCRVVPGTRKHHAVHGAWHALAGG
jgi:hypothetical protein